jgi:hypothetical protein
MLGHAKHAARPRIGKLLLARIGKFLLACFASALQGKAGLAKRQAKQAQSMLALRSKASLRSLAPSPCEASGLALQTVAREPENVKLSPMKRPWSTRAYHVDCVELCNQGRISLPFQRKVLY